MELTRRQFLIGLAATTAIVTPAVMVAKMLGTSYRFIGVDIGRPGADTTAAIRYWFDGNMLRVEHIAASDFYVL